MHSHELSHHPDRLLSAHEYTPEELADLTGIGIEVIRRAAYDHEITAEIVGKDIVSIPREAAIEWLNRRASIRAEGRRRK